jgi:hypothetical protein
MSTRLKIFYRLINLIIPSKILFLFAAIELIAVYTQHFVYNLSLKMIRDLSDRVPYKTMPELITQLSWLQLKSSWGGKYKQRYLVGVAKSSQYLYR